MTTGAIDEFDSWLESGPSVTTPSPPPAPTPTTTFGSWFGSGGSSLLGATGSTLLSTAAKNLEESTAFISSQAREVADTLHKQQLPADGWAALGGVTNRLKASLDENMTAFNREASLFCTKDALQKERDELKHAVTSLGTTVVKTVGLTSDILTIKPMEALVATEEFVAITDAPAHLKVGYGRQACAYEGYGRTMGRMGMRRAGPLTTPPPLPILVHPYHVNTARGPSSQSRPTHPFPPSFLHRQERLREAILQLATSESTFTSSAPALPSLATHAAAGSEKELLQVELSVLRSNAKAALAFDDTLRQMRFQLVAPHPEPLRSVPFHPAHGTARESPMPSMPSGPVCSCVPLLPSGLLCAQVPSRLSEADFWNNYFVRVLRERRIFQLPPLKPLPTTASPPPQGDGRGLGEAVVVAASVGGASAASASRGDAVTYSIELTEAEAEADAFLQLAVTPPVKVMTGNRARSKRDPQLQASTIPAAGTAAGAGTPPPSAISPTPLCSPAQADVTPSVVVSAAPAPPANPPSTLPAALLSTQTAAPPTPVSVTLPAAPLAILPAAPPNDTPPGDDDNAPAAAGAAAPSALGIDAAVGHESAAVSAMADSGTSTDDKVEGVVGGKWDVLREDDSDGEEGREGGTVNDLDPEAASGRAATSEELEAKIAAELDMEDDEEEGELGGLVNADEEFDNVLADDDI